MPYKNKEDRKKQKPDKKGTKAYENRLERQRARRKMDKTRRMLIRMVWLTNAKAKMLVIRSR